jgi:hypothetical protein
MAEIEMEMVELHVDAHQTFVLMSPLIDFIQQETWLQCHGRLLGVKVEPATPKCHPEISRETIEHDWGCAEGACCRLPISEKRTKSKFRESAKKAMDWNEVLSANRQGNACWPATFWMTARRWDHQKQKQSSMKRSCA